MLNKLIQFSIRNKLVISLLTVALIVTGIFSVKKLPIDAVPDITNNQVQVLTLSGTLATQEVEKFVTYPIERAMATLPDIVEIRSISRFGLSVVTIVFRDHVNTYFARQLVSERLKEAESQIPPGAGEPELGPVSTGLGEIYQYIIRPKEGLENKITPMELRTLQDWIVARQLLGTPGVAEVNSFGGLLKQYEVSIDPGRLKAMNVTIPEIFTALEKNNENTGGAYIEKKPNVYFIRALGLVNTLEDIGKIVVKTNSNGIPVLIRDVATPGLGSAIRYGSMTKNGQGEVVGGIVMMLKGANSAEVVKAVKERIGQIQKSLPEGIEIEPFLDRTDLVNRAIHTVAENLILGFLIVVFVLVLFLGNLRAGLIAASVIPLSMLFAVIMMNLFGVSGNLMSLGAIDFGIIVDGAVIIVEAIVHRIFLSRHHHTGISVLSRTQMDEEVSGAATQIVHSSFFGQIIILIVYLPILVLVGIEGKMFKPMAQTVSFAILGAFILSITYLPMLSSLFLSRKTKHAKNLSDKMIERLHRFYIPVIRFALKNKWKVIVVSLSVFVASAFVFKNLGGEFIPTLEEGDFAVETILPQGSSLLQTVEVFEKASAILKEKFPEVKEVVGKIGSAEIPTDPMPINTGDMMVILKNKAEWKSAHNRNDLARKMGDALAVIPGVTFGFQQPIQMRFNELMTGIRQDVAVKIFGENMDTLLSYAKEMAALIGDIKGTTAILVEAISGLPQITIRYDRDKMARYGVNVDDLNRIVRTAFAGEKAGLVFENERRFDLVLRLQNQNRRDIDDIKDLFVPIASGTQVPLQQLADIDYELGPAQITREDAKRRISVGFNVPERDVKSVVAELQDKLNKKMKLPPGYYFTYGGQFQNLEEASQRLSVAVPVSLALIFVLLFFAFGNIKQCLLVFSAIPFSAIGGVLALWIAGMPFSISAGIGFIALFGVSVLNGIVLIDYFNRLEKQGITDITQRILEGTKNRFRSVIMTGAVPALGFLPMVISKGAGAEVQKPLATVVIGGLVTATVLTLVVLPVLYSMFLKKERFKMNPAVSAIAIFFLFIMPAFTAGAQAVRRVSINATIDSALKNNLQYRVNKEQHKRAVFEKQAASEIPKTGVFVENEDFQPTNRQGVLKIGLSQGIDWPGLYKARKNYFGEQVKYFEASIKVIDAGLKREVRSAYYQLWYLEEKQKLFGRLDSIYSSLYEVASLRVRTGDVAGLDSIAAEARMKEIRVMKNQLSNELLVQQQSLMQLLNTEEIILPEEARLEKLFLAEWSDSIHPVLALQQQNVNIAGANVLVQRNTNKPEFSGRFFSQHLYGMKNPYSGFSVSAAFPLFGGSAYRGKVRSAMAEVSVQQRELEYESQVLSSRRMQALSEIHKNQTMLDFYESTGLRQADQIIKAASIAYSSGEIGFAELSQFLTQAIDIQKNYLDILNQYNQSIIQYYYFINR